MSAGRSTRDCLDSGIALLTAAGVPSAAHDAAVLLAEILGVSRGELGLVGQVSAAQSATYDALIRRRARREPLQHIVGKAWFRHLELAVGPGVFVPRPETEVLVDLALDRLRDSGSARPTVVDLCAGSGAVAIAIATEFKAKVLAVELDETAVVWAERNAQTYRDEILVKGSSLSVHQGDARLAGDVVPAAVDNVDLVTCNPPYIPDGAVPRDPEVRNFDPPIALYGGPDGLDQVRAIAAEALRLLRPGGWLLIEHGDAQGSPSPGGVPYELASAEDMWSGIARRYVNIADRRDLAGRPRVTVAQLATDSSAEVPGS